MPSLSSNARSNRTGSAIVVTLHRNPAPDTSRPAADVTVTLTGSTSLLPVLPTATSDAGGGPEAAGGVLTGGVGVAPLGVLPPAVLGGLGAEPPEDGGGAVAPLLPLGVAAGAAAGGVAGGGVGSSAIKNVAAEDRGLGQSLSQNACGCVRGGVGMLARKAEGLLLEGLLVG
jgi:hypothetical protein